MPGLRIPLEPVIYGPPRNIPTGLDWPEPTTPEPPMPPPTPTRPPHRRGRNSGRHPQLATMIRLYGQGMTAPAIADQLGCIPRTVRSNLRRAGVKLRDDRTGQNLPRR